MEPEEEILNQETSGAEIAAALDWTHPAASREAADTFLNEQTATLRTRREHLHERRAFQISHLKWRRFSDWARAGWQLTLAALALFWSLRLLRRYGTRAWQRVLYLTQWQKKR